MDIQTARCLQLFITFQQPDKEEFKPTLKHVFNHGKHELSTRLDLPFYTRAGYQPYTSEYIKEAVALIAVPGFAFVLTYLILRMITGDADDYEKFLAFATIMPKLMGNSVYYWAHLELKIIFGITKPLNESNAKEIYDECNKQLENITTQSLLNKFKVELVCTTDDPTSTLDAHGKYNNTVVAPTFRPDALFALDENYLNEANKKVSTKTNNQKNNSINHNGDRYTRKVKML